MHPTLDMHEWHEIIKTSAFNFPLYFDCTQKLPIFAVRILILKCINKWHKNQSAPQHFNCTKKLPIIYWSYTGDCVVRILILNWAKILEFPKSLSAAEIFRIIALCGYPLLKFPEENFFPSPPFSWDPIISDRIFGDCLLPSFTFDIFED